MSGVELPIGEVYVVATEYVEAGRLDAADRLLGHILKAQPNQPDALHLSGLIAFRRGKLDLAAATVERALRIGPAKGLYLRNIAEIYRQLGRLDEAAAAARRGMSVSPSDPMGAFNLSMVEYDRLDLDACIGAAREAIARKPDLPEAHMKLGQALLAHGDFVPGWEHYEWRYRIPGAARLMPPTDRPQWDGTPMPEARLLLIADQGYGDVIMFGRLITWVMARCANVTIAGSIEMRGLLEQLAPGAQVVERWDHVPPYAAFCPLSGLPRLASLDLSALPGPMPYLSADPARVATWARLLEQRLKPARRRIALAWSGRPTHSNDRNRSVPLAALHALANVQDTAFVSLQKGPQASQSTGWPGPAPLLDLDAEIETFEDTAAILANVDLLISVDTSVVHLAGALGHPAWVMLPYAPDWRWLLNRDDTPWYPSLRLFRQPSPGDWATTVGRMRSLL